jgi:hypothetical protein
MARKAFVFLVLAGVLAVAAAAASAPSGTYSAKITGKAAPLDGTWKLAFLAGGSEHISLNGRLVVVGKVSHAGAGRLRFHDVSGPYACGASVGDGIYRYALAGQRLTLTAVSDRCAGRKTVLTAKPFVK